MVYSEAFTNFLIENNIPVDKHLEAYNKVLNGLKPRYFRIPYKYTLLDTSNYNRVSWLKDIELFQIEGKSKIPDNAIGLDAASAASVEALRLSCLMNQSEVNILDMCCAPGGKLLATASALARLMPGEGKVTITGMDSSYRRLQVCKSFLLKEGLPSNINVKLICADSREDCRNHHDILNNKICELPTAYDRVLVDIECSHEGSIRSIIRTFTYWNVEKLKSKWLNPEYIENLVETQYKLLNRAIDLCKPGGIVVYSTCSLISKENEGVVNKVLNTRKDVRPMPLPTRINKCSTNNVEHSWPASPVDLGLLDEMVSAVLFDVTSESSTTDGQFIASLVKD